MKKEDWIAKRMRAKIAAAESRRIREAGFLALANDGDENGGCFRGLVISARAAAAEDAIGNYIRLINK